jgi:hypothetical protein
LGFFFKFVHLYTLIEKFLSYPNFFPWQSDCNTKGEKAIVAGGHVPAFGAVALPADWEVPLQ